MMMKKLRLVSVVCCLLALGIGVSWGESRLEGIMRRGELVIALADFENRPFFFEEDGQLQGLDVDLGKLIAQEIGVKPRFIRLSWDGLIALSWYSSYPWKQYDLAIATITIRPSRSRACSFSECYFYTGQKLLVRKGAGFETAMDLEGKSVAVLAGSTGYETAKSDLAAQTVIVDSPEALVQALLAGEVDAVLSDATIVDLAAKNDPDLVAMDGMITTERYGVVMPKDAQDLKPLVDKVIVEKRRGLYEKWFK
ncbi:MAG: hypothetical protein CSA35_04585 [Dethiosulfovibrio peptidovorans]|nr:MAG: hypothetical protein CSA35_04585 [Dethiosulfovibrio peptidovorans]